MRPSRGEWLLAALAALLVVFPAVHNPPEKVLGLRYVDGFGTQWWFWFFDELVAGRVSFTHTDLLFFPTGKDVFAHTGGNLLDALASWPLRRAFSPTVAYNLWIGVVIGSNVLAGARLGNAFTGMPGWPAGLILGLNPYVLREIEEGRPTQAWLALPALALAGVWRAERWGALVGTGALVAATGWTYWYYGLTLGVLAVLVGVVRLLGRNDHALQAGKLAFAGGVALLLVLPGFLLIRGELASGSVPGLLDFHGSGPLAPLALRTMEGDDAGLHVFAPLLGLAGALVDEGGLRFIAGDPTGSYACLFAALLSVVIALRQRQWSLLGIAAFAAVFSLAVATGPAIIVRDGFIVNRPWLWVVSRLPVLHRWWWPGRAIFGAFLGLAAIVPLLGRQRLALWLLPLILLAELFRTPNLPLQTWDARTPASLLCLADAPAGAVIDLPFFSDQHNLWFQTIHRHPILGGMLMKKPSFGSAYAWKLREENDFLDVILDLGDGKLTRDVVFTESSRKDLIERGFRYVVVDKSRMEGTAVGKQSGSLGGSIWERVRRLLREALGDPAAEDEGVAVYVLDGSALSCADYQSPPGPP